MMQPLRIKPSRIAGGIAAILIVLASINLSYQTEKPVLRAIFVLDITQSMNTRDYFVTDAPQDRLGYVKYRLRQSLEKLPCGSVAGLGIFTTQSVEILFAPLEICSHLAVIEDVLAHIDWRMAWAADSHIGEGVAAAIRETYRRDPSLRLVFFTDGQETPATDTALAFRELPGKISGLLVGTGGLQPAPIPHLDRDNQWLGYWEMGDIRTTDPTEPILNKAWDSTPYLSWLHEHELKQLSQLTGLGYYRLDATDALVAALQQPFMLQNQPVRRDTRWPLSLAALALITLLPFLS